MESLIELMLNKGVTPDCKNNNKLLTINNEKITKIKTNKQKKRKKKKRRNTKNKQNKHSISPGHLR